jgi:phage gpG-like protein
MASRNDFKAFQKQARLIIKGLPKMIGKYALLEASDNWRRQGYEDESGTAHQWAPRKARGKPRGRVRQDGERDRRYRVPRGRAILMQTGRLRRSPRIVSTTALSVTIGTDVPYAQPLQEGTAKMPARPFLTASKSMREKILRKAAADITALLSR